MSVKILTQVCSPVNKIVWNKRSVLKGLTMSNKQAPRKPLTKSNSPVKVTGLKSKSPKRLLQAPAKEVIEGREKVLMAARACFAKQGFAGTSMADIQKESGFSRGNIYHHFKTKEEIVQIIITQNLGRFCEHIESILERLNNSNLSLVAIIKELAALAEEITKGPGRGMAFHVWSLAMVEPDIRKTMLIYFERIRCALEQKIRVLISQGKIAKTKNVQQLSVALFGIVIPAFTLQSVFMEDKAIDATTYTESLFSLFK